MVNDERNKMRDVSYSVNASDPNHIQVNLAEPTDPIVTPDGVELPAFRYSCIYNDIGLYCDDVIPESIEYKGFAITFAEYNKACNENGSWQVTGDLRKDNEGDNYGPSGRVMELAKERGVEVQSDPETSCSYFYTDSLVKAKQVVDIIKEVA